MKRLFLAWQDPVERTWFPVGRLDAVGQEYRFVYTRGSKESERFIPFGRMTDLLIEYKSTELFPLFANRLIDSDRPEYQAFLHWVNLREHEAEPLALLARTGGVRQTDSLLLFPCPEAVEGKYLVHFFSQGLRHIGPHAIRRVAELTPGDRLYLMPDPQNEHDEYAIALRTNDPKTIIGYCPRFMTKDFLQVLQAEPRMVTVEVERLNCDAPLQFRLLCFLSAAWPEKLRPCSSELYEPLPPLGD